MSVFRRNYYSQLLQLEQAKKFWFDEGPLVPLKVVGINSSSINTREIDQFRHGVEITQDEHIIGTFKISAGTPGHIVKPLSYGVNNLDIINEDSYFELDYFDPVVYINSQGIGTIPENVITFPIITSDVNQMENYLLNGIIEPLTLRSIASFYSTEAPFYSRTTKGAVMAGNSNPRTAAGDYVLTVDNAYDIKNDSWYLDAFEHIGAGGVLYQWIGYVNDNVEKIEPYVDSKTYLGQLGITSQTHGEDMTQIFTYMTGTTGNYIPPGKRSATSGFVYEGNTLVGTDSLAFGGMSY